MISARLEGAEPIQDGSRGFQRGSDSSRSFRRAKNFSPLEKFISRSHRVRQTNAPAPCNHSSARYASCVFRFRVSNRTVDNCQNMSVFVSPYIAPCLLFFSAWLPLCFLSRSVFVFFGLTRSDCVPVWSACFCVRALACLPANTPASCFHCLPA